MVKKRTVEAMKEVNVQNRYNLKNKRKRPVLNHVEVGVNVSGEGLLTDKTIEMIGAAKILDIK